MVGAGQVIYTATDVTLDRVEKLERMDGMECEWRRRIVPSSTP